MFKTRNVKHLTHLYVLLMIQTVMLEPETPEEFCSGGIWHL